MFENLLMPRRLVKEASGLAENQMIHLKQLAETDPDMGFVWPQKPEITGLPRLFDPLRAAMICLMADLIAVDVKAPLAAKVARRIMEAHQRQPEVEQWSIVITANRNVSVLPYAQTDLRTGFISGSRLRFAVAIDLRNYAEQVAAVIADAPRVIGGDAD